ncbi:DUF962 domain-containing protein [Oligoflexaceae bacterium]|nr:DUF962 domain-containing protein [Oligoflexaceae bacterium]
MRKIEKLLLEYKAYHSNEINTYLHWVGVPVVTFSIFLFLAWFRFIVPEVQVSLAMIFFLASTVYYVRLDRQIGLIVFLSFGLLLILAEFAARLSFSTSIVIFLACFGLGWVIQFIGHYFEGRRPALLDNIWQVFNAPIFVVCEVMFFFGRKQELKNALQSGLAKKTT